MNIELNPDRSNSIEEFDIVIDAGYRSTLARRLRGRGGKHEFLQVAEMRTLKEWGVPMDEIHRFTIDTIHFKWIIPEPYPDAGQEGGHRIVTDNEVSAPGSGRYHLEQREVIQNADSLTDYNLGMRNLFERWSIDLSTVPEFPQISTKGNKHDTTRPSE